MIKRIKEEELFESLEIFHRGYETVAAEFGLTEENCPDRGRASLPYHKLLSEFESGTLMYGYFDGDKLTGFLGMKILEDSCKLEDIIILPEYRKLGYGTCLLDYCKKKALELGVRKVVLGMIDDNIRLRNWYIKNGFVNTGYKKYENAPFTVGYMQWNSQEN